MKSEETFTTELLQGRAFHEQIGEKIREISNQKNVSIEALANEYGVDYSQVNRMELGKVNFSIS